MSDTNESEGFSSRRESLRSEVDSGGKKSRKKPGKQEQNSFWSFIRELVIIAVIAITLSFLVKTFLFRAFYIPSGSMEQTLQVQDRIIVNELKPQPFGLERGNIVVFEDPGGWMTEAPAQRNPVAEALMFIGILPDSSNNYLIKRIIGMPGDHVVCCDASGKITINGKAIDEPYVYPGNPPSTVQFDVTVPEDSLWVMGDHRSNSADSRYHRNLPTGGFVPYDKVVGDAAVRIWPFTSFGVLDSEQKVFAEIPAAGSK